MDPVDQIFLQARAPTGSWEGPINAYFQGQQGTRQNRQLDMQERRLTLEEGAQAIQNESNRLAIQEHGLNIELKRKQMERDAQILAGQAEALDIMLEAGKSPQGYMTEGLSDRLHTLGMQNPAIFTTDTGRALLSNYRGAQTVFRAARDAKELGIPVRSITADRTGNEVVEFRREDTLAQQRIDNERLRIVLQQAGLGLREIDQMLKARSQGFEITGQPDIPNVSGVPRTGATGTAAPVTSSTTNPDGGVTLTPIARPLTTATVTQQQESLLAAQSALSQAAKLEPLINSNTFGPVAYVENVLIDKGLANLYPDLLNKERVEARTVASGLNAATVRALRSDSNITEAERKSLIKNVPSPEKFLSSPAEAIVQLKTINSGIVDRAVRSAAALHQPSPVDPNIITDSSLIKFMFDKGMMTREEALEWSKTHLPQ